MSLCGIGSHRLNKVGFSAGLRDTMCLAMRRVSHGTPVTVSDVIE